MGRRLNYFMPKGVVFTDEEIENAIDEMDGPIFSKDIAEKVDCTLPTARTRLNQLAESGELNRRHVNRQTIVWWK